MGQAVLRVEGLPQSALDAATTFHSEWLPKARASLDSLRNGEDLAVVFVLAPYDHRGWRLAVVHDLAREAAPTRVNGIVGDDEQAVAETLAWLAQAPGITGQLLAVDGKSAAKG